jgi:hypothetical protein
MQQQVKLMILVNVVLGVLFVATNFAYVYFSSIKPTTIVWNTFWLTFYNRNPIDIDVGAREPNFSFYFFWALLLINICFLIVIGRKKQ